MQHKNGNFLVDACWPFKVPRKLFKELTSGILFTSIQVRNPRLLPLSIALPGVGRELRAAEFWLSWKNQSYMHREWGKCCSTHTLLQEKRLLFV